MINDNAWTVEGAKC